MGIYNCGAYLDEAILTILNQTYGNWELILCDDGSSDDTLAIAQRYAAQDERIVLLRNESNLGLNKTLNKCLAAATGDIIARMDGDDLCLPERFEKELAFLDAHPEYAVVSCPMILFDENGDYREEKAIEKPSKVDVICGSPICHAPSMMRKDALLAVNGYTDEEYAIRVEDVDLWIKFYCAGYKAYNLQFPLYKMRNDREAYSRRKYKYRINSVRVRHMGCKVLKLPIKYYFISSMPMVIGLLPGRLRKVILHILGRG